MRLTNAYQNVYFDTSPDGVNWRRFDRGMEVSGYNQNVRGGFMMLRPGMPVKAVAWNPNAKPGGQPGGAQGQGAGQGGGNAGQAQQGQGGPLPGLQVVLGDRLQAPHRDAARKDVVLVEVLEAGESAG